MDYLVLFENISDIVIQMVLLIRNATILILSEISLNLLIYTKLLAILLFLKKLQIVRNILMANETSSKTFRYTLRPFPLSCVLK